MSKSAIVTTNNHNNSRKRKLSQNDNGVTNPNKKQKLTTNDNYVDLSNAELDNSHMPFIVRCLVLLPKTNTITLNLANNKITDFTLLTPILYKVDELKIDKNDIHKLPDFSKSSVTILDIGDLKNLSCKELSKAITDSSILSITVKSNALFPIGKSIEKENMEICIKTFKHLLNKKNDMTGLDYKWYKQYIPLTQDLSKLYKIQKYIPDLYKKFNKSPVINDNMCKVVIQSWLRECKIQNINDVNALISSLCTDNDTNAWSVLNISRPPTSFVRLNEILPSNIAEDDGVNTVGDTITDQ